MPAVTTKDLIELVRSLPLLDARQLAELERLARQGTDARALAREMIQQGWLTPYQANQLLQGRAAELVLGSYLLLERIGEGGMGQVFKARHQKMGRMVALKLIRKDRLQDPDAGRRFEQEIRAAAQLSHPNIVAAYDAAQVGDSHFLVMEYVEGIDLARQVKEGGPLPVEQAVAYVTQAALGLQHAHERGMVHRDIKPSNLLVSVKEGGVKILDMGLARVLEGGEHDATNPLTETEVVIGTPDYEAPEQAMHSRQADIRADLYSLGCTLYFLLTGRPPFPGGNTTEKLVKHQLEEPVPVEQLRSEMPPGLANVLRKLMAKRPEDRYQTPAELITVLEAGLKSGAWKGPATTGAIRAGRATTRFNAPSSTVFTPPDGNRALARFRTMAYLALAQTRRFLQYIAAGEWRGRKGGAAGVAGLLLLLLLIVWLKPFGLGRTGLDRLGSRNITAEDRSVTGPLEGLVAVLGDQRLRQWGRGRCVAVSPDGKVVASGGEDHSIRIWDSATGQQLRVIPHSNSVNWLGFFLGGRRVGTGDPWGSLKWWEVATGQEVPAPPGRFLGQSADLLATAPGNNPQVKLWDAASGQERLTLQGISRPINSASFSSDGLVAAGGDDQIIYVWESSTGKPRHALKGHGSSVSNVWFAKDGKHLASYESNGVVKVWELASEKPLFSSPTQWAVAFARDGKTLALRGPDGDMKLWDTASGKDRATGMRHENGNTMLATFSPDGSLLATGTQVYGDTLKIWDAGSGAQRAAVLNSQAGAVTGLAFFPDNKALASISNEGRIKIWEATTGQERLPGNERGDWYTGAIFGRKNKTLVLTAGRTSVKLWDIATAKERATLSGHQREITATVISPDDQTLATASMDGTVKLWDLTTGQLLSTLNHGRFGITSVHFSADSKTVASSEWYSVKIWDTASGQMRVTLDAPKSGISMAALTPDAKTVAMSSNDGVVQIWDVASKRVTQTLGAAGQRGGAQVGFAADGQVLIIKNADGTAKLWDLPASKDRATLPASGVWSVAPDGQTVTIGLGDGRLQVWDVGKGQVLAPLEGHSKPVRALAYSFDGQWLASAGEDGKVIVWNPASRQRKVCEWQLPGPVHGIAFASDGRHLATVNGNGSVYILRQSPESARTSGPGHEVSAASRTTVDRESLPWAESQNGQERLARQSLAVRHRRQTGANLVISGSGRSHSSSSAGKLLRSPDWIPW